MINPDLKGHSFNEPFPILLIENVFSPDQLDVIWKELDYYCANDILLAPEDTGGAYKKGKYVKQNSGLFLTDAWKGASYSAINKHISPILQSFPHADWVQDNKYFEEFQFNKVSVLVSNYTDGDYYDAHRDLSLATCCLWLYKEPKQFAGGEFSFTQYDVEIECKNNSMVIFPGLYKHQVSPVSGVKNPMDGRFCISYFLSWIGNEK